METVYMAKSRPNRNAPIYPMITLSYSNGGYFLTEYLKF